MFNFLFQGNLGEMIAPITGPEQQLLIAIQNNQREKIKQLLEDQRVPPTCRNQQGVSPIHMACQAGQRDLAEMLVDMGADLQCKDNSGNTCLHFAAKGASLELVQWLLAMGLQPQVRNSSGQSAYDMSQNHIIRQYLLPLQLRAETGGQDYSPMATAQGMQGISYDYSGMGEAGGAGAMQYSYGTGAGVGAEAVTPQVYTPTQMHRPSPPNPYEQQQQPQEQPGHQQVQMPATVVGGGIVPPFQQARPQLFGTGQLSPGKAPAAQGQAQMQEAMSSPPPNPHPSSAPPSVHGAVEISSPQNGAERVSRTPNFTSAHKEFKPIKADGFHSSASDKNLQKRYNHTKVEYNLAPPPTFGAGGGVASYSAYGQGGHNPSVPAYVSYNAVTNTAVAMTPPPNPHMGRVSPPPQPFVMNPMAGGNPGAASSVCPQPAQQSGFAPPAPPNAHVAIHSCTDKVVTADFSTGSVM